MDRQEMEAVFHLQESKGWEYVKEFINANIQNCNNRLSGHGREIEDLKELKKIQARKKAFQEVLNFVDHRRKKLEKKS